MTPVKDYAGKRVLITSGPNHEPIDPMRYIGNRSSGKMGYALALKRSAAGRKSALFRACFRFPALRAPW